MKRAIDDGLVEGPRLFVATRAIVATSSYGPGPRGFRPDLELPSGAQPVSGVDAAIAAVREQAGRGADWIRSTPTTASARTAARNRPSPRPN